MGEYKLTLNSKEYVLLARCVLAQKHNVQQVVDASHANRLPMSLIGAARGTILDLDKLEMRITALRMEKK